MLSFLVLLLSLLSSILMCDEQTAPDIRYEDVFGEKAVVHDAIVPFYFNSEPNAAGSVKIFFSETGRCIRYSADPVIEMARIRARPEHIRELLNLIDENNCIDVHESARHGFTVLFDEKKALLNITIDPSRRETISHTPESWSTTAFSAPTITPAPLSAYLNANAGEGYIFDSNESERKKRQPITVSFDGSINIRDTVFEGAGDYSERNNPKWTRSSMRFIRDVPEKMMRISFGDLTFPTRGFQKTLSLGGIAFTKNFEMQSNLITYPICDEELFLEHPSVVEVWSNGQLYETYQLDAGTHQFTDLPTKTGPNDIVFKVIDNTGREKEIHIPFLYTRSSLSTKVSQHNTALGCNATIIDGRYRYRFKDWSFHHFYRRGVTNSFTFGEYFQAAQRRYLMGCEGVFAITHGIFTFDTAASHIINSTAGIAIRSSFSNFPPQNQTIAAGITWDASTTFYSRRFSRIDTTTPNNDTRFLLSASAGSILPYSLTGKVGVQYRFSRSLEKSPYSISCNINRHWSRNVNSSLQFNYSFNDAALYHQRWLFTLTWAMPKKHQYISFQRNFNEETTQTSWHYSSPQSINSLKATVAIDHSTQNDYHEGSVSGSARYAMQHGVAQIYHRKALSLQDSSTTKSISQMSLGTSFVYADNSFSIGRPISESFVIISRDKRLKGNAISVLSTSRNSPKSAVIGTLSGVMPSLSNYQKQIISIDTSALPTGIDIGPTSYVLLPRYKNGYHITITRRASIMLDGVLVDEKDAPRPFISGYFIDDTGKHPPVQFFSDNAGRFFVIGLNPGRFTVEFISDDISPASAAIPEGISGRYSLGRLTSYTAQEHMP